MRRIRTLALAAPLAILPACTYLTGDDHVLVSSTPPGASILIDGMDSGRTTPAMIQLDGLRGSDHSITIRKNGYGEETRRVLHYTTAYTSNWFDGAADAELPSFPLFWTFGDFLLPFAVRWRYVPHEVHAMLYKPGEGPVTDQASTR